MALETLIRSSGTVRNQASLRGRSIPLTSRETTTKVAVSTANPASRKGEGSSRILSSPASMKWIGTTISVVISIIRPARSAPQRTRPMPRAANMSVATIASEHLPTGDQSRSPSIRCAPTVELTTMSRTARQRISFCQCSWRNSPATLDQEKGGGASFTLPAADGDVGPSPDLATIALPPVPTSFSAARRLRISRTHFGQVGFFGSLRTRAS